MLMYFIENCEILQFMMRFYPYWIHTEFLNRKKMPTKMKGEQKQKKEKLISFELRPHHAVICLEITKLMFNKHLQLPVRWAIKTRFSCLTSFQSDGMTTFWCDHVIDHFTEPPVSVTHAFEFIDTIWSSLSLSFGFNIFWFSFLQWRIYIPQIVYVVSIFHSVFIYNIFACA